MNTESELSSTIPVLSIEEARVLGCLLEKEMTTPDLYPLTLNSLTAACNQKSNREPVVEFDVSSVARAVEDLRYHHFAATVHEEGARAPKTRHTLDRAFPYLTKKHFALIAVLLLRGQQTLGELRARTERMFAFSTVEDVQAALDDLIRFDPDPLVAAFPAGGGRRVASFAHLFRGEAAAAPAAAVVNAPAAESPTWREEMEAKIAGLETGMAELRAELDRLRGDLGGG